MFLAIVINYNYPYSFLKYRLIIQFSDEVLCPFTTRTYSQSGTEISVPPIYNITSQPELHTAYPLVKFTVIDHPCTNEDEFVERLGFTGSTPVYVIVGNLLSGTNSLHLLSSLVLLSPLCNPSTNRKRLLSCRRIFRPRRSYTQTVARAPAFPFPLGS